MARSSFFQASADEVIRPNRISHDRVFTSVISLGLTVLVIGGVVYSASPETGSERSASVNDPVSLQHPVTVSRQILSERQAVKLFDALADDRTVPFSVYAYECDERAEKLRQLVDNQLVDNKHIEVMKIWDFQDRHKLYLRLPHPSHKVFYWKYHVAITLKVMDAKNQVHNYVFDPTIFNGPATIDEWAKKIHAVFKNIVLSDPDSDPPSPLTKTDIRNGQIPMSYTYSKDEENDRVNRAFNHYYNKGTIRLVYPTALRNNVCAQDNNPLSCEGKGKTWQVPQRYLRIQSLNSQHPHLR